MALTQISRQSFTQVTAANMQRSLEAGDQVVENVGLTIVTGDQLAADNDVGFTTTYTLGNTVNEHNSVKYDGKLLFSAPCHNQVGRLRSLAARIGSEVCCLNVVRIKMRRVITSKFMPIYLLGLGVKTACQ